MLCPCGEQPVNTYKSTNTFQKVCQGEPHKLYIFTEEEKNYHAFDEDDEQKY